MLAEGTIDAIVSDHRPQDQDSKRVPFAQAEPGGIGLETLLPISLELVFLGLLIAVVVGLPLGVISAVRRDSVHDYGARVTGLIGISIPHFWLATRSLKERQPFAALRHAAAGVWSDPSELVRKVARRARA